MNATAISKALRRLDQGDADGAAFSIAEVGKTPSGALFHLQDKPTRTSSRRRHGATRAGADDPGGDDGRLRERGI